VKKLGITAIVVLAELLVLYPAGAAWSRPRAQPSVAGSSALGQTPGQTPEEVQALQIMSQSTWSHTVDAAGTIGAGYRSSYVAYDRNGNVVDQITYDNEGGILRRIVNSYDSEGTLVESVGDEPERTGVVRSEFSYDGERITRVMSYRPDGTLITDTRYEYDDSGRITVAQTEAPDAGISQRLVYEYNDADDVVTVAGYDAQGRAVTRSETVFDADGRPLESTGFLPDGGVSEFTIYTYGAQEGPTEIAVEDADGVVLERTTNAYDVDGRLVESVYSTPAADLEYRVELEYDDDGVVALERTYNKLGQLVSLVRHVYEYYDD
jgi:hypothetical protein